MSLPRIGQLWISGHLQKMIPDSNPVSPKWHCNGYGDMVGQAILADDIETFNERVKLIKKYTPKQLSDKLDTVKEKYLAVVLAAQKQAISHFNADALIIKYIDGTLDENSLNDVNEMELLKQKEQFYHFIRKEINEKYDQFSAQKKLILSISPFFEGIVLYQQGFLFPHLFEEHKRPKHQMHTELVAPLVIPQKIKIADEKNLTKEGQIHQLNVLIDAYDVKELSNYFKFLRTTLEEKLKALKKSSALDKLPNIVFSLASLDHHVTIGYDPNKAKWIFGDINYGEISYLDTDEEIAKIVLSAYTFDRPSSFVTFATKIMVTRGINQAADKCLDQWSDELSDYERKKSSRFAEKAKYIDSESASLLHIAAANGFKNQVGELLQYLDPNIASYTTKMTPLYVAADYGQLDALKVLLKDSRILIDPLTDQNVTPLFIAAQNGHAQIIKLLLEKGANPNHKTANFTPLATAIAHGHTEVVRLLLECSVSSVRENAKEVSPLLLAVKQGHLEIVKLLLQHGADANGLDSNALTPLFLAAKYGHVELVKFLLTVSDNTIPMNHGAELLGIAAEQGHVRVVNYLLESKVDPDSISTYGTIPLLRATETGQLGVAKLLIQYKANPNYSLEDGTTLFYIATQNGHLKLVQYLLPYIKNPEAEIDDEGNTAFFAAVENDHPEVVQLLLEKKFNPNQMLADGSTPLMVAAENGSIDVIDILLANGANINLANHNGETPLTIAALYNQPEIVRFLLEKGADPYIANRLSQTPIQIASKINLGMIPIFLKSDPELKHQLSLSTAFFKQSKVEPQKTETQNFEKKM